MWIAEDSERLLLFLQQRLPVTVSGKALKKALESNICRVNGRIERFASRRLSRGDRVELRGSFERERQPLRILWEDAYAAIVDKPAGWVCEEGRFPYALAHRLDKETSGALLLVKGDPEPFQNLFRMGAIQKEYWALVDGLLKDSGECKSRLVRKKMFEGQTIWGSSPHSGLPAHTRWQVLRNGLDATLLSCEPVTGRTHQIRVHLAEIGHPLLVDRQYARQFRSKIWAPRPLLHSHRLAFLHPITGESISVDAPLPPDFESCLAF